MSYGFITNGGGAMTLMERFEEMREHLLHPHHDDVRVDKRHEREPEERDHHHVDLATGSEFLDVM
jgi:hypothetical protein